MNNRLILFASAIIFMLGVFNCSNNETDIVGEWQQNMTIPEQRVNGVENLTFNADKTFNNTNVLCYVDSNEYFYVKIPFTVSIDGEWNYNASDDQLSLNFNRNTFTFKSEPAVVKMTGNGDKEQFEKVKSSMEQDVKGYLEHFYHTNYSAKSMTPMVFTNLKVVADSLTADMDGIKIKYNRKK